MYANLQDSTIVLSSKTNPNDRCFIQNITFAKDRIIGFDFSPSVNRRQVTLINFSLLNVVLLFLNPFLIDSKTVKHFPTFCLSIYLQLFSLPNEEQ